ncbi:MAG: transporter substrate-binding domain-containing protein [Gammaproteobacteria bacterium]|nr:MAG: transporter substrate-binding domain-containing protein [Gammaproteobacteria bacterium]
MLKRICIAVAILLLSTAVLAESRPVITLNTAGNRPLNDPEMTGFMDQVAAEAFRRIGYQLQTVKLPAERGLINSNLGIEDGEMGRIAGLQRTYPNLIQVKEKIMDWEFVAVGDQNDSVNGWKSLAGRSVAFVNGWKILERSVPKEADIIKVRGEEQLLVMLQRNRVEFIIYERWGILALLEKYQSTKKVFEPPLIVKELFIYLHKKHSKLIGPLENALINMKQDGTYKDIEDRVLTGRFKR